MAEVRIEVGSTGDYRYLGIQPPLTKVQKDWLRHARFSDDTLPSDFEIRTQRIGGRYSEVELPAPTSSADPNVLELAHKIARVLTVGGDMVVVDESLHLIGHGQHLFAGQPESRI